MHFERTVSGFFEFVYLGRAGRCGRFIWRRGTLEVRREEGEGSMEIVDGFEVEVTFIACRKGVMTADHCLRFVVYLQRKCEKRVHHDGAALDR